jgi:murein DD-endopeptidase MepM/ murein hydrolase activator NlpD
MLGLTTLLIIEYRFFHDQAQKMLELKEEYRAYTIAVKKILNEYNAMKEQADEDTDYAVQETSESKDSFIVVNREPNYLKKSTIEYCRKQNLDFILKKLDPNEWLDYTDQIKKKAAVAQGKKKRTRRARRTANVPLNMHYADAVLNAPRDFDFAWPIKRSEFWLSSFFGPRRKTDHSWGFHYGIDMAACRGTPVLAAADGIVIQAHSDPGYGNTILISHNNKYKTRYAHLDRMLVSVGQKVDQGMVIGKVGSTGHVRKRKGRDASHLHFEVSAYGKKVNPLSFFM